MDFNFDTGTIDTIQTLDTTEASPLSISVISGTNGNTGTFTAGDTITQATSGATAVVAVTNANATPLQVYFGSITGTPDATHQWSDTTNPGATFTPTSVPTYQQVLYVLGTGAVQLPFGTTAQEPNVPVNGMLRFNTSDNDLEYYNGTSWQTVASTGNTVTSVQGTSNQIAANGVFTPQTGAVVLTITNPFVPPGVVEITNGLLYVSYATVSAAGATQGTATVLTAQYNNVTTVAAGTGVQLPTPTVQSVAITITNNGANPLNVYPQTGAAINGAGTNTAVVLPVGASATYSSTSSTQWYSTVPPVVGSTYITVAYTNGQTVITNAGVTTFSTGTTGLTPVGPSTGAITLAGTLVVANGGTGATSFTAHGVLVGEGTSPITATAAGTTGQVLTGNTGADPTFVTLSTIAVTSVDLNDTSTTSIYTTSPTTPTTGAVALTITLKNQNANTIFAGPASGGATQPTFRSSVYADIVPSAIKLYSENASSPTNANATGTNAVAIGNGSTATATNALGIGLNSKGGIWGAVAIANGDFSNPGDAQQYTAILRATTTTNASALLWLDGAAATQRLLLPLNSVWAFNIQVSVRRTDATGTSAAYTFVGMIHQDATAATTTLDSSSKTVIKRNNLLGGNDPVISADTTNGALAITVTGTTGFTLRWVATVQLTQVTN